MRLVGLGILAAVAATPGQADPVAVPSGIEVTRLEILQDQMMGELWLRFRYLAPRICKDAGKVTFDVAAFDIDHLCEADALPYVQANALNPARIVVSMSDRPLEFGVTDPAATQFFGAYRVEDNRCIWEEF